MKIEQCKWTAQNGWSPDAPGNLPGVDLVLLFGSKSILQSGRALGEVRSAYPKATLTGCSTAGEICDTRVSDDTLISTAVSFRDTRVEERQIELSEAGSSRGAGERLGKALEPAGLKHVFVLSDGTKVNGSDLVRGLTSALPFSVGVTGGLSGDGTRFEDTLVLCGDHAERNRVSAIGFYGDRLHVGCGSLGGWDPFGPERLVTRSSGAVLYQLDGKSALDLYKKYLGEHAEGLPATGLLFPLSIRSDDSERGLVRTILAVNEEEHSLTFAGDVPEGNYARLMKANFDRLVDGASDAAKTSLRALGSRAADLAILISCVGRKMVLKQRIEEEVEAVREVLGEGAVLTGFYSYGEISPFTHSAACELHNQTMTITTFAEA